MAKEKSEVVEKVKEAAARIGESTTFSSKSHFNSVPFWKKLYYFFGITTIVLSAIVTYSDNFDTSFPVAAVCGFFITIITAITTLLNPSGNHSEELRVGNEYKDISERARILYDIKPLILSDKELLDELECLMAEKSQLDSSSSQSSNKGYQEAKEGIEKNGEADFKSDEGKKTPWCYHKKSKS